jgi:NADH-quinone oxidoreductase subunit C
MIDALPDKVEALLQGRGRRVAALPDEVAFEIDAPALVAVCTSLRDTADLRFEQLMDVAGVDYLVYGRDEWETITATRSGFSRGRVPGSGRPGDSSEAATDSGLGEPGAGAPTDAARRFAVAYQLLSVSHNQRLRLRVYCEDEEDPAVDSLVRVWASANWFEREVFDLFGIVFRGHPDLRRILTDYGFIGHAFRKDFPLIGNVEVRYDPQKQRVVYEPVSIEPRVLVPKVIREDHRYEPALKDPSTPR